MNRNSTLPLLVVFGLDYTFWPFQVATNGRTPFFKYKDKVLNNYARIIPYEQQVSEILRYLKGSELKVGIVSTTSQIKSAHRLIKLFGWDDYISMKEIYPGNITQHFERTVVTISTNLTGDFLTISSRPTFRCKKAYVEEPTSTTKTCCISNTYTNMQDAERLGVFSLVLMNEVNLEMVKSGLTYFRKAKSEQPYSTKDIRTKEPFIGPELTMKGFQKSKKSFFSRLKKLIYEFNQYFKGGMN